MTRALLGQTSVQAPQWVHFSVSRPILPLSSGNYRLGGGVLVVTLEPCAMCAAALVHARLAGVAYGAADRLAGAVTSCTETLDQPFFNHRVWHMGGVLARESVDLLQDFFAGRRD